MLDLDKVMESAVYSVIEEDQTFFGEIPTLKGLWACKPTLEECCQDLREALNDWVALRLKLGLEIPTI